MSAVQRVATGGGVKHGLFIASAAAVAVAPLIPLPAKAEPLAIGLLDFSGEYGAGLPVIAFISDEMLRSIERNLLKMPNITQASARRSATPGCIDVNVVEMAQPQWIDIKFTAAGDIDLGNS